jgi:translation initiation factor 2D
VYTLDGVAALVDSSGRGDLLVPTAMALWRAPGLLPRVQLKHPAVSQFIVGAAHGRHGHGADVMLPGVDTAALPPFAKGALVSVCVPGNPAPIAAGLAALSSEDMRVAGASGGKGKAVEILQAYGDFLYAEAPGKPVPNEGFLEVAVAPLPGAWSGDDGEDAAGAAAEAAAAAAGDGEGSSDGDAAAGAAAAGAGEEADGSGAAAPVAASGAGAADGEGAAPVDMDALLEAALLQALHKSVKDGDLPLAGSALWWAAAPPRGARLKGRLQSRAAEQWAGPARARRAPSALYRSRPPPPSAGRSTCCRTGRPAARST